MFDRETGALRGTYETDAFFCFHHVNAFERESGELVVDLVAYDDASIIDALYLDDDGPRGPLRAQPSCAATRSTSTAAPCAASALPDGHDVELPRIDYGRRNTRDYRFAYFAGWRDHELARPARQGRRARRRRAATGARPAAIRASRSSCASRARRPRTAA